MKLKKKHREDLTDLIIDAFQFARKVHDGQEIEPGKPYISHCKEVARILCKYDAEEETVIAGLLHGVVEHAAVSLEEIYHKFGADVAYVVDGVTTRKREPLVSNYNRLKHYAMEDKRVIMVKLADRIEHLSALPESSNVWRKHWITTRGYIALGRKLGYDREKKEDTKVLREERGAIRELAERLKKLADVNLYHQLIKVN